MPKGIYEMKGNSLFLPTIISVIYFLYTKNNNVRNTDDMLKKALKKYLSNKFFKIRNLV
jgi:hypothetical protein